MLEALCYTSQVLKVYAPKPPTRLDPAQLQNLAVDVLDRQRFRVQSVTVKLLILLAFRLRANRPDELEGSADRGGADVGWDARCVNQKLKRCFCF